MTLPGSTQLAPNLLIMLKNDDARSSGVDSFRPSGIFKQSRTFVRCVRDPGDRG